MVRCRFTFYHLRMTKYNNNNNNNNNNNVSVSMIDPEDG